MQVHCTPTTEGRTMTETRQSQRGWFSRRREQRQAKRQARIERDFFEQEQATEPGGIYRSSRAYQHSGPATFFGGFGGGDGGGGGGGCGDGGGGGGC
jgi:hypothetical protein